MYSGSGSLFIADVTNNHIAEKLTEEFGRRFGHRPSGNEIRSWQNSLRALSTVMSSHDLGQTGVLLEVQLPLSSRRLDVMLTGQDGSGRNRATIIELKQWDAVEPSNVTDCVVTYVGGRMRDVVHPSAQARDYAQYMRDFRPVFTDDVVVLDACAYLHNLSSRNAAAILDDRFGPILAANPSYTGDRSSALGERLARAVGQGDGREALGKVKSSPHRASRKLLEHTAKMVAGQSDFVLLDDQRVAFNAVVDAVQHAYHDHQKVVFVIHGGPGTGKSVIALQLLGELNGRGFNAQHATGSRAFTENLWRIVGPRAKSQFRYYKTYALAERNEVDVLISDESHRIREMSTDRWHPKSLSGKPQIEELVNAAKVGVFLLDEIRVVRPGEVGSIALISEAAERQGARVVEYELETQFRCGGSDGFVGWVDNTLGIRETANEVWEPDPNFELRLVGSPYELERVVRERAVDGHTARLAAGYCWTWSDPNPDGSLVDDVKVGTWSMPWNAKPNAGRLAAGVPKCNFWASAPEGIGQVGCVYTAQGFEYDYAGLIWGLDLRYDPVAGEWVGDPKESHDGTVKRSKGAFLSLVKNTYRVLLTRGMKGCYIYCVDDSTRAFLESRIVRPRG